MTTTFNPIYSGFEIDDLVIKNKGDQLKFKIYDGEGAAVYLDVEEVRKLRDYLTSVLPESSQ
jgi:hypothetical protein